MTLAIGFGATRAAAARGGRRRRSRRASPPPRRALRRRLGGVPRDAEGAARQRRGDAQLRGSTSSRCSCSPRPRTRRYRGASIASPTMPWIWGTLTLEPNQQFSGPYHLVWPRDLYHVATAQKAAGDGAAADRLLDYLWQVQKPDGSWWQNTVRQRHARSGRPSRWTRCRCRSCSPGGSAARARRTGRTSQRAADYLVANGPRSDQERWENQDGYSPNTIATEIAGLICAADIARANGDAGQGRDLRGDRRRVAAAASRAGPRRRTARTRPSPYYLRVTKDGEPERRGTTVRRWATTSTAPGRPARDRRQLVPRPRAVRRQAVERPDDPQLAQRRRRQRERLSADGRHAERHGLAPLHVRRLRRAGQRRRLGPVLRQPGRPDARAPVAAADRRARRVRADRRARREPSAWTRSPTPPTTA